MALRALFVDFNSYFSSVEQQELPHLRGRPVAVTPVMTDSTCCIAASYEAKKFGVKTGTNVGEARKRCPGLVVVESDEDVLAYQRQDSGVRLLIALNLGPNGRTLPLPVDAAIAEVLASTRPLRSMDGSLRGDEGLVLRLTSTR